MYVSSIITSEENKNFPTRVDFEKRSFIFSCKLIFVDLFPFPSNPFKHR
jgi:hypothetical protein